MKTLTPIALLLATLCSCALTSKSDPMEIRYFTPEPTSGSMRAPTAVPAAPTGAAADAQPLALMLGRVRGSAHLRERIAYRPSESELGFYETRRWTERPESYLRRSLSAALFQQRGLQPILAGPGATLDVELTAFEETRGPRPVARLQAVYLLYGGGLPSTERTVTVEHPITATQDPTTGIIRALAAALGEAVTQISNDVVARLQADAARTPVEGQAQTEIHPSVQAQ